MSAPAAVGGAAGATSQAFYRFKPCTACGEEKPPDDFPPNSKLSSGLSSWCAACHVAATRRWRAAHPERIAEINAARRQPPLEPRACATCGESFTPRRRDGRYCSPACRARRAA